MLFSRLACFKATAIQFGMDQMVEAYSDQISAFVHWYYWSMSFGVGTQMLVALGVLIIIGNCIISTDNIKNIVTWESCAFLYPLVPAFVIQSVSALVSLITLLRLKGHLTIEPVGHNQFTMVYKVLKYAWQHKCPEN